MSASRVTINTETYESLQQELSALRQRVAELEEVVACRVVAEQQLRESEARFEKLVANVPGTIYQFLLRPDGFQSYTFVSASCRELYEVEPEAIQKNAAAIVDMIHPDDRASVLDSLAVSATTLQPWCNEWRICTPSGKIKWVQGASRPERQADGSVIWDGLFADITARKIAEAGLAESKAKWRSLIQNSLDIIAIFDADGTIRYESPSVERILGYKPEELIGRNGLEFIHPDDQPRVVNAFERLLEDPEQLFSVDPYRFRHANGSWCYLQAVGSNLLNEPSVRGIVANCRDVTEQVYAEVALRESEERYRSVIAALAEGIILQDADGIIRACNTSAEQILGLSIEQMMGQKSVDPHWQSIREDGSPFPTEELPIHFTLRTGQPQSNVVVGVCKPDGTLTWLSVNSQPLFRNRESKSSTQHSSRPYAVVVSFADITEQKAAEQDLRKNEELYRTIARNFPNGSIHLFDRDLRYTLADGTELVKRGIPKQMWEGKTLWEVVPPDLCKQIEPYYRAALAGESMVVEVPMGDQIYLTHYLPVKNEATGEIFGGMVISQNITAIKQAEVALKKSEELYRTIAQNFPNGAIHLFDRDLRFTLSEGSDLTKIGLPRERWAGQTLREVLPEDICERVELYFHNALAGRSTAIEVPFGNQIYLIHLLPVKNEATGEIFAGMAMTQNITSLKQAEAALRQSEAQLREQASRAELLNRLASQIRNSLDLNTILATAVQQIVNLLQIDRCNFSWYRPQAQPPAWETIKEAKAPHLSYSLGIYPVNLIGPLSEKVLKGEIIRVDDVAYFTEPVLRQLLLDVGFNSLLVLPIKTRSGQIGTLTCGHCQFVRPFSTEEEELLQAVAEQLAIAINQAELYATAESAARTAQTKSLELEETLHELQRTQSHLIQTEKMSSLGQLVAGVAHEINNPVNFIYGNISHAKIYSEDLLGLLHLYQEHYPNPSAEIASEIEAIDLDFIVEDLPKILSSMEVGAERIREIVVSLRNFSRLDEAQFKKVDIHEGIESTLLILDNRLKAKPDSPGICTIKEYGKLPPVECYPGQLNQVFMNLLTNAIDALEELKTKRLEELSNVQPSNPMIRIYTEVIKDGYVAIKIADNGAGMTEEVLKNLFDPFFTTKPVGKGTGLGLSISYQIIVEKHKGDLRCISQPGVGTEFVIEIPIQQ